MPLILPPPARKLNPKKPWVPRFATSPVTPSVAAALYGNVRAKHPEVALGYGIDHRGAWARVGDSRARASTPGEAIQAALAKHIAAIA